jgi:hypothetical protein
MSSRDERRAKGVQAFNSVYGGMMTAPEERTGDEFFEIMLEDLFGNIWAREGLSLRDRRTGRSRRIWHPGRNRAGFRPSHGRASERIDFAHGAIRGLSAHHWYARRSR